MYLQTNNLLMVNLEELSQVFMCFGIFERDRVYVFCYILCVCLFLYTF